MNKKSSVLILFVLLSASISAEELKCKYFGIYVTYMCEMSNVFNESQEITSVSGDHVNGKAISDVQAFYIKRESLTEFVPTKVCSFLYNLYIMNINGYNLEEIKKEIFAGCPKLNQISIENINLKELDEDLLSEVPNLEKFSLSYSKVEVLKKNFFQNNLKLKWIVLRSNNFKIIETEFPTAVAYLSITNNLCVNGHYTTIMSDVMTLANFTRKIHEKCSNKTDETETKFISYDTIKSRIINEQAREHRDKIIALIEDFQSMNFRLIYSKFSNLQMAVMLYSLNVTSDQRLTRARLDKLKLSYRTQSEVVERVTTKMEKEAKELEDELERRSLELEEINGELMSKVQNIFIVIVLLMCLQVVMAGGLVGYGYYKR